MLKAILWDNDGVLVDTEKYYFKATKELFKKYGAELTKEDYFEYYLKQNTGAWHLLGDLAGDENKLKETLNLPADSSIVGAIAFGIPDEEPSQPRKKPLNEIFHFDKW